MSSYQPWRHWRLSRPCYDKVRRCPGWAGGGFGYAKTSTCASGNLDIDPEDKLWAWRFHRCDTCGVTVMPSVTRWIDPAWLRWCVERARMRR